MRAEMAARRLVLLGCGKGDPHAVRQAVQALGATLKTRAIKRAALVFATDCEAGSVGAAVRTMAEAGYVYTATKSKAEMPALSRVTVGVSDAGAVQPEFAIATALAVGVEYAREWANRPANHATPTLIGEAAKALGKHAGIQCKLHGPAQVAKLGMGAALMVAAGVARAETTDPSAAITAALGAIVPAIMTAITTTISSVAPVIALAVGMLLGITMASHITDLVQMLPYVVTIIVLIVVSMRKKKENQPPAHLGLAYFREER